MCKDCLGCNKQELNTFKEDKSCNNYIKDMNTANIIKHIQPQQIRLNESIRRLGR